MKLRAECRAMANMVIRAVYAALLLFGPASLLQAEESALFQYQLQTKADDFVNSLRETQRPILSQDPKLFGSAVHDGDDSAIRLFSVRVLTPLNLERDHSIMFFRTRVPSRYSYESWAGVKTGYGELFHGDYLGRSRTNGAGIQDQDWFYLKLSFRF